MDENMSNEERRRAHRAARRRAEQRRKRIFYGVMFVIVLVIGLILSFTVFFNVSKIEIRGYSIYSNEEIISCSGVEKGDNLFLINKDKVVEHITEKLAYIGDVSVKISLPNKLVVTVYETSVKTAVEVKDGFVLLNEDGKVLAKVATLEEVYANAVLKDGKELTATDETTEGTTNSSTTESTTATTTQTTTKSGKGLYVLEENNIILLQGVKVKEAVVGSLVVFSSEKTFEIYTQLMNLFIENSVTGITSLNLSDPYNIVMRYEDRIDVKVGSITNIEKKMAFAAQVIKDQDEATPYQEGVIDATLDDKAYFSPTTTTTAPPTTESTTTDETTTASNEKSTSTTTKKSAS